jgi:hypothetical protein
MSESKPSSILRKKEKLLSDIKVLSGEKSLD